MASEKFGSVEGVRGGGEGVSFRFRSWRKLKMEQIRQGMAAFGAAVVEDIKASLSEPYPPSAEAGRPPHRRTGELREGVSYEAPDSASLFRGMQLVIRSGRAERGEIVPMVQEYGSVDGKQRPHPYMRPALAKWGPRFTQFIADFLKRH